MEQVLKLDKDCEEAVNNLFNCKVLQLMVTPTHKSSVDVTRIICMPSPNDSCDPRKCFFFFFLSSSSFPLLEAFWHKHLLDEPTGILVSRSQ